MKILAGQSDENEVLYANDSLPDAPAEPNLSFIRELLWIHL